MIGKSCNCKKEKHDLKKIVLTGGPGAGKTAVLETIKNNFCEHVVVLPEAAGILFGGGFWRHKTLAGRKAAQRAIFHVQKEIEIMVQEENNRVVMLCDRGTLDGLAYWPAEESLYWEELRTTREKELSQYSLVIHLRVPKINFGYNQSNPLRIETESEALAIDTKIEKAWEGHPRRFIIDSNENFLVKIKEVTTVLNNEIPACCKRKGL